MKPCWFCALLAALLAVGAAGQPQACGQDSQNALPSAPAEPPLAASQASRPEARAVSRQPVPPIGAGELVSLSAMPATVVLRGSDELLQLVITGHYANGGVRDLTASAAYRVRDESIARVAAAGKLVSVADGATEALVECEGKSVKVAVAVHDAARPRPLNFTNDIVPLFSKLGCNSGACHGKSSGQNGFRLSLLGFTPEIDYDAIAREGRGRRIFPSAVDQSLLLRKASGRMPHGGGTRIPADSRDYRLLARWIQSGMPQGSPQDPTVQGIVVSPPHRLIGLRSQQQVRVTALYSDGTTRDVTADAEYHCDSPELLEVSASGLVRTNHLPGEGAVMVRFLGHVDVFRATIPLASALAAPSQESGPAASDRPKFASFIDEQIFSKLDQLGIPPAETCSDSEFLRRASIDICGTLPTPDEVRAFLGDDRPQKRQQLVQRLLERPEYADYFAQKWGDILRNRQKGLVGVGGGEGRTRALHAWIRGSLAENKPYDQFAREILTARGTIYGGDGHPAVGWYNVLKTPAAMTDDIAQVFLGTRIGCAQCHHHPYEKWSQDDYWGMAAFFARVKLEKPKENPPREFNNALSLVILDDGSLANPQGKNYARPRPLGGDELAVAAGDDPRQHLARWMTEPDNAYFARALVNRYWAHFFGRGIIDPPDDMRVTNPPSHPQLLDELAEDFVASGFDLKHLIRRITSSAAYQLSSMPNELNQHAGRSFARMQPRRLPAEVLLDAIDQVTGSPTPYAGNAPVSRAIQLPDESVSLRGGYRGNFLEVFGKPKRDSACECERVSAASLTQSLYMIGSEEIHRKLKDRTGRAARLAADPRPLEEKIDELFLCALARHPAADELNSAAAFLLEEIQAAERDGPPAQQLLHKQAAYEDLIWALINTKEFMFNH